MAIRSTRQTKRIMHCNIFHSFPRNLSLEAEVSFVRTAPRTSVINPAEHTHEQLGLWYTVTPDTMKKLFGVRSQLPTEFMKQVRTFTETSFMIRQSTLSVMDLVRKSDLSLPPNKYVFYGEDGVGKSICIAHLIHFFYETGWTLVHVPWFANWSRRFKEIIPSVNVPGRYDHTIDAGLWLQHFKSQNESLLNTMTTGTTYEWSKREITIAGAPLVAVVEHGINRARYASECIYALTTELKRLASDGKCRVAVIIDGVNALFTPLSKHKREDRSLVSVQDLTLYHAFSQLLQLDWKNGCILASTDALANSDDRKASYLPRYLLRRKGWEMLDPFVPIHVTGYNDLEMQSIIDYYLERRWLTHELASTDMGRRELTALSGRNGFSLMKICAGR